MSSSIPILVVDDSSTMTLLLSDLLRNLGYTDVDVANDGDAALEQLRQKQYGLLLSDWEMHPMSGEEFLKKVKQDPSIGRIPVILITAKTTRGVSWLAGADAYLAKPFNETDLSTAIKRVLASRPK